MTEDDSTSSCLLGLTALVPLCSKKVKLTGVVTEDSMTGDRYVTHVTVMEDIIGGAKLPEPEQSDSLGTAQGKERVRASTSKSEAMVLCRKMVGCSSTCEVKQFRCL